MISMRGGSGSGSRRMTEAPKTTSAPLVLYVDDERPNRIVFEQSLKQEFRIATMPDARSALAFLEQEDVAVVVSDIRMPEMDGLEFLTIVRDKYPNALRMVITAFSDIDPILRAINDGLVSRYIVKPFEREELQQALRWGTELWSLSKTSPEVVKRMLVTERFAALGSLTALYLHDLRTPLTATTLLLDELPSDDEELVSDLKAANIAVSGMVADLWGFIRPPKTKSGEHVRLNIDPLPYIKNTLAMYQKLSLYQEAKLVYTGPSELPQIRMSPTALTQVLLNLVGNAAQAVVATKQPGRVVEIEARPSGDMLEVQIRDEGVGMPPDVLKRIGTPYFTTRAEGTGLGVANVQRLVGTAGGRVKIDSTEGVGTTVTLMLPLV